MDEKIKQKKSLYILAMVNVIIWAIAIIGMVIIMENQTSVKNLFPILASGVGVGIAMISAIAKLK